MRNFWIMLSFFYAGLLQANPADVASSASFILLGINNETNVRNLCINLVAPSSCPKIVENNLKNMIDQPAFLSLLGAPNVEESCITTFNKNDSAFESESDIDKFYSEKLGSNLSFTDEMKSCFEFERILGYKPSPDKEKFLKNMVIADLHHNWKKLDDEGAKLLSALNEIDKELGTDSIIDLNCQQYASQEMISRCVKLKMDCRKSIPAESKKKSRDKMKGFYLEYLNSKKIRENIKATRDLNRGSEYLKLSKSIELIEEIFPVFKRQTFKENETTFVENLDAQAFSDNFDRVYEEDLNKTKNALKEEIEKKSNQLNCISGKSDDCEDFRETVSQFGRRELGVPEEASGISKNRISEAQVYLTSASCVRGQTERRDDTEEILQSSSINLALTLTPFSWVGTVKLLGLTQRVDKLGRAIGTSGSHALAANEVYQSVNEASGNCESHLNKLEAKERENSSICTGEKSYSAVSDYKSCVIEAAFASIDALPFAKLASDVNIRSLQSSFRTNVSVAPDIDQIVPPSKIANGISIADDTLGNAPSLGTERVKEEILEE
ncbi:MAG: hypothetical protein CME70_03920 [Halobacteriovorax sp.]|nr:hypothetical protein [Halobacteriovorax sp.]